MTDLVKRLRDQDADPVALDELALEAADRIEADEALMRQALESLELGRDYAEGERLENERRYKGHEHLAPDDAYAVGQIDAAIAALRERLGEQP